VLMSQHDKMPDLSCAQDCRQSLHSTIPELLWQSTTGCVDDSSWLSICTEYTANLADWLAGEYL